jgi:hypothetical protein
MDFSYVSTTPITPFLTHKSMLQTCTLFNTQVVVMVVVVAVVVGIMMLWQKELKLFMRRCCIMSTSACR